MGKINREYEKEVTSEFAKQALSYDPTSGVFTWNVRPLDHFPSKKEMDRWNSRHSKKLAGSAAPTGYITIRLLGKHCSAHRLAWIISTGEWPRNEIDHVDGNPSNNKLENLRQSTAQENSRNQKLRSTNTSGICGVSWDKDLGKWKAQIGVSGVVVHLGCFTDIEEARQVRLEAQEKFGFDKTHGRR